jgi:hypothetical protein
MWKNKMTCIKENDVFICDDLIDVWSFSIPQAYGDPVPYGNYLIDPPPPMDLKKIQVGDMIKISRDIDKIWTRVVEYDGCETIIAVITDSLDLDHPFSIGDKIQYEFRNVYEIIKE